MKAILLKIRILRYLTVKIKWNIRSVVRKYKQSKVSELIKKLKKLIKLTWLKLILLKKFFDKLRTKRQVKQKNYKNNIPANPVNEEISQKIIYYQCYSLENSVKTIYKNYQRIITIVAPKEIINNINANVNLENGSVSNIRSNIESYVKREKCFQNLDIKSETNKLLNKISGINHYLRR